MTSAQKDLLPWLGFSVFEGIGPLRFKALTAYFGTVAQAWNAREKDLEKIHFPTSLTRKFLKFREEYDFPGLFSALRTGHITVLIQSDERYPALLKQIPDPPIVVYVKGQDMTGLLRTNCVGVVGTRKITHYGSQVTGMISTGLAAAGITVVSGMAYGVDTVAHRSAIEAGGKTIAVLGCGVDIAYPAANAGLYDEIVDHAGAVISEFPPGMLTLKGLFPSRNRIISGLSLGIVVTEGASDSGALITATSALEQGREVFAVPGPITSYLSEAPNLLIKQGAKPVTDARDILEDLHIQPGLPVTASAGSVPITAQNDNRELTHMQKEIIRLLAEEPLCFDELVRKSCMEPAQIGSMLTLLEMNKIIERSPSGSFTIVRENLLTSSLK